MRKQEILDKFQELEKRFNSLGDIPTKIVEIESYINRAKASLEEIDNKKQESEKIKNSIETIEAQVTTLKKGVEEVSALSQESKTLIEQQKQQNEQASEVIKNHSTRFTELSSEIEKQLGSVSAQVLSNSFGAQANKLEISVKRWFAYLLGATFFLFITATGVVIWELLSGGNVWSANFLLKTTVTAPIIYFIFFVARQYGREKRLLDEYSFKSSVALSFEAYRKLLKEDSGSIPEQLEKTLEFIIASVGNIYSSPMENIYKNKDKDEVDEEILTDLHAIRKLLEVKSLPA